MTPDQALVAGRRRWPLMGHRRLATETPDKTYELSYMGAIAVGFTEAHPTLLIDRPELEGGNHWWWPRDWKWPSLAPALCSCKGMNMLPVDIALYHLGDVHHPDVEGVTEPITERQVYDWLRALAIGD